MISRARGNSDRYFFTQILPAFNITTFFQVFCVRALDSLINYSFFMNSVLLA